MQQSYSSIGRGLRLAARRFPDKPALVEIPRLSLTYAQLDTGVNRLAHRLADNGVAKGDHVGVLSENSIEHIVSLYAIARLGAVSVALDPKWTAGETARAFAFFDCRLLILDRALTSKMSAFVATESYLGVLSYEKGDHGCGLIEESASYSAVEPQVDINDEDVCTLMLTSGTTGLPKGVMRTHRNVETGCINGVLGKAQDEFGRELAVVPLYYGSGRGSVISQIYLGATVYVLPRFDAERAAWTISRERITAVALAPTMCGRLLSLPNRERFDFSSLTSLRKAGSPFTLEMVEEVSAKITPNIYQAYSSTETGTVTLLRPAEQVSKLGSSGRPVWGVEIVLMDEHGRTAAGGEGEICVRGPNVCQGYYKNPDEEAKAIRNGWFRTGDIGRFDSEGYLFVVGRIKEMIKTGSINVFPREVETVLLAMPQIRDAAVVGVPDREWGEAVKAFVVAQGAVEDADVLAHCRSKLAGYKVPKSVVFVDAIERNDLGKVTQEFKARAR